jgi:hypothetical protein
MMCSRKVHLAPLAALALAAGLGPRAAAGTAPTLDALVEEVQGAALGTVVAIEPIGAAPSGAAARYAVVVARDGSLTTREVQVVEGGTRIDVAPSRPGLRPVPPAVAEALRGDSLPLAAIIRRATQLAPGFRAIEAEIESTRQGVVAEVELVRRDTVIELALEPRSGTVVAIEVEGEDDEDDDEGEDDGDDLDPDDDDP